MTKKSALLGKGNKQQSPFNFAEMFLLNYIQRIKKNSKYR
jgi:hypothetical protein